MDGRRNGCIAGWVDSGMGEVWADRWAEGEGKGGV